VKISGPQLGALIQGLELHGEALNSGQKLSRGSWTTKKSRA